METLFYVLGIPLLGSLVLAFTGQRNSAREINVAFSLATFVATCMLTVEIVSGGPQLLWKHEFFIDPLNVFLVTLTSFVGLTTAIFSRPYMRIEQDHGKMTPQRQRLYHSMYQLFSFTMLLALTTNNMGILWVAMEAATLTTVLLVSVYRTAASLEAAWKYFILCGVGIAQALFGTVLLYMAAEKVIGTEAGALLWTNLDAVKTQLDPTIITLAFAFLFIGYGTKVGLVPMHNWLPDAHAEGPTPVSAVLSGLLLNVAVYALLRCKVLTDGALGNPLAGELMMGFGLLSVVVAAFFLSRQKDVKRMFAYSSIEHMGLITFAFGMGGAIANYAGLLHMTVHSLIKSAIFFAVGHATQKAGTQNMADIRGLIKVSPRLAWGMMLGSLAILGMPPFGVFASEFLILTTAMRDHSWATPFLLLALGVAFAAVFSRVQPMAFGETSLKKTLGHTPALFPVFAHLGLGLMLGLYIPPYLHDWYRQAAAMIGG
ncbi:MAG: hydrogenase 4 subunit F [Candidatus Accumulibacter sp.]|nr:MULTISPECIES: hydrogenase 4 subunit F [unclassified Candidatus Accumulibacter]MBL8366936.1 hydrogenase 4 subunit F [Accumulibacter sp.]MBN8514261.1 hydrogenase 4 subunit F [Accumulibacter sp.]HRE70914.1 hydrogenase 4 subunit F [Accumulibacter sp.]HRE86865.1 hydrogenase 4 subunit F [Accumulibacter sp.]